MDSLQEIEKAQRKEDDAPEVSYMVLVTNHKDPSDILQQVADCINLQLTLDGQNLPLIAPNWFDDAKRHDKLFLYGPSGCGKSRNIFELIKHRQGNIEKIFIINP
jgi:RecA-family ATPase